MTEMKRILGKGVTGESQLSLHLKRLDDRNPAVKKEAARILGEMRDQEKVVVPALIRTLKETGGSRNGADELVYALAKFGPSAKAAIPDLSAILKDRDRTPVLRQRAAHALGKIDAEGSEVVPLLSEMVGDSNLSVVVGAAMGLGVIGSNAGDAVPSLEKALVSTRNETVRDYLQKALNRIQAGK